MRTHRLRRTRKTIRRGDEEGVKPMNRAIERISAARRREDVAALRVMPRFYLLSRKTRSSFIHVALISVLIGHKPDPYYQALDWSCNVSSA